MRFFICFFVFLFLFPIVRGQYVETFDDVSEQMLNPDFWISRAKNPRKILMDESQIKKWNERQNTDIFAAFRDKRSLDSLELYDIVCKLKYHRKELYDSLGNMIPDSVIKSVYENLNLGAIKNANEVNFGVVTCYAEARTLPTNMRAYQDNDNLFFDDFINSSIYINEPVAVLHSSSDGKWYLIQSSVFFGWIEKKYVALCGSYESWKESQEGEFLVITGNRLYMPTEPLNNAISNLELFMGCKLKLVKISDSPSLINERHALCSYVVKVPVRNTSGMLEYKYGYIPYNADVHIGYPDYTISALINQAFKMLGDRYGWGGMFHSRDCSKFMVDIYNCFGIILNRNSAGMSLMSTKSVDLSSMDVDEKIRTLKKDIMPGTIIYLKGHVLMYLGMSRGKAYFINALSSYFAHGKKIYVQSVVVNSMNLERSKGALIDALLKCVEITENN